VTFINTDGMAFIGPGSEWFWTAISGIVLAVTFIAIYRQLRLQRSQGAIEQIDGFTREWGSERFLSHRLNVLVALQDGTDPAHVPDAAATTLSNYWESIGTLARAGHLDRRLLWDAIGNVCEAWWRYLGPQCLRVRADEGDSAVYENFEWLVQAMHKMDLRAGSARSFDEVTTAAWIAGRVASTREQLRLEQSLRTVILASPDAVPTVPPATPAAAGA
jgi:hypothetical protein